MNPRRKRRRPTKLPKRATDNAISRINLRGIKQSRKYTIIPQAIHTKHSEARDLLNWLHKQTVRPMQMKAHMIKANLLRYIFILKYPSLEPS